MKPNLELKGLIVAKYSNQRQFAKALRVDESTVSKVVRGHLNLTWHKKCHWMRLLNCDKEIFDRV